MSVTPPKAPDLRDFQIYHAFVLDGKTQQRIASEHQVTQGRVSQIIRRVRMWVRRQGALAQQTRPALHLTRHAEAAFPPPQRAEIANKLGVKPAEMPRNPASKPLIRQIAPPGTQIRCAAAIRAG